MIRILFCICPFFGHVLPTLEIVRQLSSIGYEVYYSTTENFHSLINEAGANFVSIDAMHPYYLWDDMEYQNSFSKNDIEKIINYFQSKTVIPETYREWLEQTINTLGPSIVLYDYVDGYWAKVIAEKHNIKTIAFCTTFAMCKRIRTDHTLDFLRYVLRNQSFDDLCDKTDYNHLLEIINRRIRFLADGDKTFDIASYGNARELTIVNALKTMQPYAEYFDNSFVFIGHTIRTKNNSLCFCDKEELIYISLGTTKANDKTDFFQYCIKELGYSGYNVIMSVPKTVQDNLHFPLPNNIRVDSFIDQKSILSRAKLFITHAGMNSATESLYYNVPMVSYPIQGDQFIMANQIEQQGVGITLTDCFPGALHDIVNSVFSNKDLLERVNKLGEEIRNSGGADLATSHIQNKVKDWFSL